MVITTLYIMQTARDGVPRTAILVSDANHFKPLPDKLTQDLNEVDCRIVVIGKIQRKLCLYHVECHLHVHC